MERTWQSPCVTGRTASGLYERRFSIVARKRLAVEQVTDHQTAAIESLPGPPGVAKDEAAGEAEAA